MVIEWIGCGFVVLDGMYDSNDKVISLIIASAFVFLMATLAIYFGQKSDKVKKVNK